MGFYSLGRVGERDIEGLVQQGHLPPSALDVERAAALARLGALLPLHLEFVAYGNEDRIYGEVAQAEVDRREQMEAEE